MRDGDSVEMQARFCRCFPISKNAQPFFNKLVEGVVAEKQQIDPIIVRYSSNWKISRMPCVDRNILRIAVFELIYCEDIPYKVSINEAIDVGKKYGTEESGPFINGILDGIRIAIEQEEMPVAGTDVAVEKMH
jgi:transcription antitermination protein NusB